MLKYLKENRGKISGGLVGFLLALLLIIAWPVILVIFLVLVGIFLGAIFDVLSKARKWLEESVTHRDQSKKD